MKKIIELLYRKRDKERYAVIQKRWELEQMKAEIERVKKGQTTNEIRKSGT